jgi:tetratricopeptide (TPR) repeat protein
MGNSHQFGLAYHFGTTIPEAAERKPQAVPAQASAVSPVPVTVFVAVPANPPVSTASVMPQTLNASSGVGDGALVMNFEEAPEGLLAARSMAKEGRSVEAVKAYVDWIGKNPRDAQAWWELGVLYYRLGKKDYAVKCFESVLNLQPGNKNLADWLEKNRGR